LTAEKPPSIHINRCKKADKCVDVSTVRHWVQQFRSQGCSMPVASGESKILFFKGGIQKFVKQWQKCIEVGEDYVEK
jgi:hypothetical protein